MMNLNPSSIKCLTENIKTERRTHQSNSLEVWTRGVLLDTIRVVDKKERTGTMNILLPRKLYVWTAL